MLKSKLIVKPGNGAFNLYFCAMDNNAAEIKKEIDKYKASIKKIKNIVPLITVLATVSILFYSSSKSKAVTTLGLIAVFMYVSSFVWAYFKCLRKIKNLEVQMKEL